MGNLARKTKCCYSDDANGSSSKVMQYPEEKLYLIDQANLKFKWFSDANVLAIDELTIRDAACIIFGNM